MVNHFFNVTFMFCVSQHVLCAQSRPTLCDPTGCSPTGSFVLGFLQARILEWVAMRFSLDLPNPGIKTASPALQANSLLLSHQGSPSVTICSYKIVFSYIENFYALCSFQICDTVLLIIVSMLFIIF